MPNIFTHTTAQDLLDHLQAGLNMWDIDEEGNIEWYGDCVAWRKYKKLALEF